MTGIVNLISDRLSDINFTSPLSVLDLLVAISLMVSFLFYLRRFPVFRVVLGTFFLLLCSAFFFWTGFTLTALVFGVASNLIIISLPLIFAPEIRHYLEKLGRFSFVRLPQLTTNQKQGTMIKDLIGAVFELAERKIGATIVIQRKTGLGQTTETGSIIDAKLGTNLLLSIFFPKSPLHDGAAIVKDGRILAAGCLLPISPQVKLDSPFGTRHKSGLSITKDTDAVVILVSEQRAEVSLAENGKLNVNLDRIALAEQLQKLL